MKPPESVVVDTTPAVITITKVKKPWYAWRAIVVRKMKQSIPEYRSINGLQEKGYAFTEDHKRFGGIYFWQSGNDPVKWFNQSWYDRTEKAYGQKGIVEYYNVVSFDQISDSTENGNYWATLTKSAGNEQNIQKEGWIRKAQVQRGNSEEYLLLIWTTRKSATDFLQNQNSSYELFYIPVYINNKALNL